MSPNVLIKAATASYNGHDDLGIDLPRNLEALGNEWFTSGKFEEAERFFQRAIEPSTGYSPSNMTLRLGYCYAMLNKWPQVETILARFETPHAQHVDAVGVLARAAVFHYSSNKDLQACYNTGIYLLQLMNKAYGNTAPQFFEALRLLAEIMEQHGDEERTAGIRYSIPAGYLVVRELQEHDVGSFLKQKLSIFEDLPIDLDTHRTRMGVPRYVTPRPSVHPLK